MNANTQNKLSTLTNVYNQIVETQKVLDDATKQIEIDFGDPDDDMKFFYNPIGYSVSVRNVIDDARKSFTRFVVNQLNDDYKNLTIDKDAMNEYTKEHGFNAADLIEYIDDMYADEDSVTLQQIKAVTTGLIPYTTGYDRRVRTIDEIGMIGDTGFVLHIYGCGYDMDYESRRKVETFLKLVDITLRGIRPSEVDTRTVELGKVYKDDKIKSLRYFKNNALKVVFHTVEDCEAVKSALFEKGGVE